MELIQRKCSRSCLQKRIGTVDDIGMCLFSLYQNIIQHAVLVLVHLTSIPSLNQHFSLHISGFFCLCADVPYIVLLLQIGFRRFTVEQDHRHILFLCVLQYPHDIGGRNRIPEDHVIFLLQDFVKLRVLCYRTARGIKNVVDDLPSVDGLVFQLTANGICQCLNIGVVQIIYRNSHFQKTVSVLPLKVDKSAHHSSQNSNAHRRENKVLLFHSTSPIQTAVRPAGNRTDFPL